jgi:pimeloyl-ACP methyl ester carboxylesterase
MPHVVANDVRLYYEERGTGTPILGIHGAGSSALVWEDAAESLSALGRVITYDRRGSTRSERPHPYDVTSVREHADDALALLRELGAEPAILVGRSYGGTIALDAALRQADAVIGLALLEAGPMGLSAEYDEWFASLAERVERAAETHGDDAIGELVVREVFGAWEELPAALRDVFTANSAALRAELRGGEHLTDASTLTAMQTPTLIVGATSSPAPFRRANEALSEAIPHARFVMAPGDHAIDPAGPAIREFVSTLTETGHTRS